MPVIIDPRRHDAVLFDAALPSTESLVGHCGRSAFAPPAFPRVMT
jgi:hypothetical protein